MTVGDICSEEEEHVMAEQAGNYSVRARRCLGTEQEMLLANTQLTLKKKKIKIHTHTFGLGLCSHPSVSVTFTISLSLYIFHISAL